MTEKWISETKTYVSKKERLIGLVCLFLFISMICTKGISQSKKCKKQTKHKINGKNCTVDTLYYFYR